MWPFRRRSRPDQSQPVDSELWEAVRRIVREEIEPYLSDGRVELDESTYEPSEHSPAEGALEIRPARPEATGISISVGGDEIGFDTGNANAWDEIWTTDPRWEEKLRQLIRCVRDGRYRETVRRGWVFPLKVTMIFEGASRDRDGSPSDYVVRYGSTLAGVDGSDPMPTTGDFTYAPW
jgi:hypothetical protein